MLHREIWLPAILSLALPMLACSPYQGGSFQTRGTRFPDQRSTRGCLDIAIQAAHDAVADGPVLDIYLGNHCNQAAWVDLPSMQVSASLQTGETIYVGIYDPRSELRAAVLGGRESVVERLELEAPADTLTVCAHLDKLTAGVAVGPPQVLCTEVQGV